MSKILIILLAFIVLIIAAFSYILGTLRRMFGISLKKRPTGGFGPASARPAAEPVEQAVLYHDSNTEVLRGESSSKKSSSYSNIRDVSFVEGKTPSSSRPQK
jgi:hypothetical protein